MAGRIEDYAVVGDTQTAALVGRDGSIDWLCLPRFDSGACFAALLGEEENGHWLVAPAAGGTCTRRRYLPGTLILETEWETPEGTVRVVDFMPPRETAPDIVRIVYGVSGRVPMRSVLRLRFDYGQIVPWVHRSGHQLVAVAGPDATYLRSDVPSEGRDWATYGDFEVEAGDKVPFVLTWHPSHLDPPEPVDPFAALPSTESYWHEWTERCTTTGRYADAIVSSLLTLKALTYSPTGGVVAAATTSLPEDLGGVRNWDYRFCWLRDATLTLAALLQSGFTEEAEQWRGWLLRAIAGSPKDVQIMYGLAGERRLLEFEAGWLSGYEGSRPVRIGNAAVSQLQLDVFGEVMNALTLAREHGVGPEQESWAMQRSLVGHLEECWTEPDEGVWEIRGDRQHFTYSKVMCWVAFDRAALAVDRYGLSGPAKHWRATAEQIRHDVLAHGFDADRNTFVQAYGSRRLDASLLLLPRVGFLPPDDPRIVGTVDAVAQELADDGFVLRYRTDAGAGENMDGLPGREGAFLACSFWLADALDLIGRRAEARTLFERLLALRNDVGLLAEEYDVARRRMLGNFPQAFSHVGLVNTAYQLTGKRFPPVDSVGGRASSAAD